jgi:hypothetical protein
VRHRPETRSGKWLVVVLLYVVQRGAVCSPRRFKIVLQHHHYRQETKIPMNQIKTELAGVFSSGGGGSVVSVL